MRADKRTLVALDTRLYIPLRHIDRDAAFFIGRRTVWKRTVLDAAKSTDRKRVTLLAVHRTHHLRYKRRLLDAVLRFVLPVVFTKLLPVIRHFDFDKVGKSMLNRLMVHLDHRFALFAVCLYDSVF